MAETKMKDVALNPTLSKDQSSVVNLVDAPTGTGAKHAQPLSAREKFEKAVNEGRMPSLKFTAQHFKTAWKAEDVEAEIPMLQELLRWAMEFLRDPSAFKHLTELCFYYPLLNLGFLCWLHSMLRAVSVAIPRGFWLSGQFSVYDFCVCDALSQLVIAIFLAIRFRKPDESLPYIPTRLLSHLFLWDFYSCSAAMNYSFQVNCKSWLDVVEAFTFLVDRRFDKSKSQFLRFPGRGGEKLWNLFESTEVVSHGCPNCRSLEPSTDAPRHTKRGPILLPELLPDTADEESDGDVSAGGGAGSGSHNSCCLAKLKVERSYNKGTYSDDQKECPECQRMILCGSIMTGEYPVVLVIAMTAPTDKIKGTLDESAIVRNSYNIATGVSEFDGKNFAPASLCLWQGRTHYINMLKGGHEVITQNDVSSTLDDQREPNREACADGNFVTPYYPALFFFNRDKEISTPPDRTDSPEPRELPLPDLEIFLTRNPFHDDWKPEGLLDDSDRMGDDQFSLLLISMSGHPVRESARIREQNYKKAVPPPPAPQQGPSQLRRGLSLKEAAQLRRRGLGEDSQPGGYVIIFLSISYDSSNYRLLLRVTELN